MSDWSVELMRRNSRVRSVLVSHHVDLGRLSVHVYPSRVSIRGYLAKLPGIPTLFTAERVEQLMDDLRRVPKVRRIVADLENWCQEDGSAAWVGLSD